jgi:hypothetical protein
MPVSEEMKNYNKALLKSVFAGAPERLRLFIEQAKDLLGLPEVKQEFLEVLAELEAEAAASK